jgi:type VI secretion system protein ImpK
VSDDDPFGGGGSDRTVMRPTPGGRKPRPGARPAAGAPPPAAGAAAPAIAPGQMAVSGVNELVAAAGPLFSLVGQLADTASHPNVDSLAAHVSQEINTFEATAKARGLEPELVLAARYVLCTLLDEIVLSTPWGAESSWGAQTLLIRFHKESWGGEKFFQIVDRSMQDPGRNLDLLEFLYICMALGLGGKYRVQQDGQRKLQEVQENVFAAIRSYRGDYERDLSPAWQGLRDTRPKLVRYVPLWAVTAVAGLILAFIYSGFLYAINDQSDPVVTRIAAIGLDSAPIEERVQVVSARRLNLAEVLSADTQTGLVEVKDESDRSVVTMWGLFPPGQAQVDSQNVDALRRVGVALNQFPGRIVITGHTDNVPIRSLRFPSNWTLSERRAESVYRVLVEEANPDRMRFEGRGDSSPLVPNQSAENRAINRRVEVVLFPQAKEL